MKNRKGFTLVELIVVIAVLALLAVLAVVAFRGVQESARQAAINADASRLANHLNILESTYEGDSTEAVSVANDAKSRVLPIGATRGSHTFEVADSDVSIVIEGTDVHMASVRANVTREGNMWVNQRN